MTRIVVAILLLSGCMKTYVETPGGIKRYKYHCVMEDAKTVDAAWFGLVVKSQDLGLITKSPLRAPAVCPVNAEKFQCGSLSVVGCVNWDKVVYVAHKHPAWCQTLVHEMIGYLAWTEQIAMSRVESEFLKDPHYKTMLDAVTTSACAD